MQSLSEKIFSFLRDYSSVNRPIKGKEIARFFDIDETEVRALINIARRNGLPICATNAGYYYSSDVTEVEKTIVSMTGRVAAQIEAIRGLEEFVAKAEKRFEK